MALTISHRCQNIAPSPTLAIDARAKEMKAAGVDVIGFGAGEPDFPTPAYICDAAMYQRVELLHPLRRENGQLAGVQPA